MEIVLLAVLAALIFGPAKLPEIGRSIGRGMRDFKDSIDGTGVGDVFDGVNEVRSAVSPTNMARAFVPGVADTQDAVAAAKSAINPSEAVEATEAAAAGASKPLAAAEAVPPPPVPAPVAAASTLRDQRVAPPK
jgi:sec-independent protein translocase protein TatA